MALKRTSFLIELSGAGKPAPTEFRLFRDGANESTKGVFLCNAEDRAAILSAHKAQGVDCPVDYEHASRFAMFANDPAEAGKAAGWFAPEERGGELWASSVKWTPKAKEKIELGEFRYISPSFEHLDDGHIVSVFAAALTNYPALKNPESLMELARARGLLPIADLNAHEEPAMNPFLKLAIATLSLSADTTEDQVIAHLSRLAQRERELEELTGKRGSAEIMGTLRAMKDGAAQATELSKAVDGYRATERKHTVEAMLSQGEKDGKVTPALRASLSKIGERDPEELKAYLSAAPVVAKPAGQEPTPGAAAGAGGAGGAPVKFTELSSVERQVHELAALPVTEAEILENKNRRAIAASRRGDSIRS